MTANSRTDEFNLIDEPSVVQTLRVTLVAIGASALVISAFTLLLRWRLTPQLAAVVCASSMVAFVLSRSGRIRLAIMLPLLSITYAVLHLAVRSDGIQNIGLAILPVLIIVSNLVLDRRTLVLFTAGIILAVVGMLAIRYFVLGAERFSTNDMGDLVIFALTCATAALVGRLLTMRIKEGFRRAQTFCLALSVAERKVRLVADSLSEMVVAYDMHRSLTYANTGAEKLTGYAPAELQVAGPLSWTHPEDKSHVLTLWDKAFDGQTIDQVVYRLITKDGTPRWVAGSWGPVVDETGYQVGVRATCLDITERMVAEEALQETTQKYRTIVEEIAERKRVERALLESEERTRLAMQVGRMFAFEWNPRTDEVKRSHDCTDIIGSGSEATRDAGKESIKRVHPEDQERLSQTVRSLTPANDTYQTQYRVIRHGGQIATFQQCGRAFFDNGAEMTRVIGVIADITERKQAETALRDSEERFRVIFSQAAVGMAQTGLDGELLLLNDRYCEILGYTQPELRGKTFLEFTHPDDREASLTAARRLLAGEISSWSTEKRYIGKDGSIVWVRLCVSLVRNQANRPQYFIRVVEDITELKLIEEQLRASEARLKEAQHLAKVGSWERDIKSDTIHWSEEMLRILGLANGAPSNLPTFLSYVHPKDREKILEIDDEVRSSIAPVEVEYRIIRPDGEMRFVRSIVEGIRDDQGVPVRISGATQDITEQVKARELLRESEGYLKNAASLAHVGYWQWDIQTNRVSGSDEMFRIFGKPPNYSPSYDDFLQMVIPQDRERVALWVSDCLSKKRSNEIEYQIAWPNGDLRTVSCISELSLGEEGLATRMFGACQDITDFRRAQRENLARQKLESIGTFASGIAHDFNNLLGAVVAQAELALGELAAGSRPEQELEAIRTVAIRGSEIVRQLMIYAGKDCTAGGLVNVTRIVEEMLQLLKVSVSKHAVLETNLGKDLPAVRADAAQLRQIVLNLVTNASEALGDRDGVIRVTTKCVEEGRAATITKGLAECDYLQLEVSDSGCGMSRETQARVFDPFFSTKSSGHGLGLAVVQGIVRGLHGSINLASEPGKGTTFKVLLPSAETTADANSTPISRTVESARPSQAFTVLVVEDEDPLRQAVVKMLRKTGFEVLEAANGSAAIELLRANGGKIDVMLLDMTIPGASSHEVFAEAAKTQLDVKVFLTSAYSQEMLTPSLSASQIRGFIRKPFQLGDLVQALQNAVAS